MCKISRLAPKERLVRTSKKKQVSAKLSVSSDVLGDVIDVVPPRTVSCERKQTHNTASPEVYSSLFSRSSEGREQFIFFDPREFSIS